MEDVVLGLSGAGAARRLIDHVARGLVGRRDLVERMVIALLSGGHVLVEGAPGIAKTRAVRRLAEAMEVSLGRVQCTPDLMPSDITGMQVFRQEEGRMEFLRGPVFNGLVLVDEINRAPPKVQSALLEAMAEAQVTAAGKTFELPTPFMVIATQNSLEHEGTFPLPEAQLDRFLMHVVLDLPDEAAELAILDLVDGESRGETERVQEKVSRDDLMRMSREVLDVHLSAALRNYIVALVLATRREAPGLSVTSRIRQPVSPRGTLALAASARARAYLHGRDFAIPEDVEVLVPDVLAHRMTPTWRALAEGDTSRSLLAEIVARVRPL
ncbi:MoxR family ATPase (plasmid) [Salipiger sp. H15]|uniref:MoxR family ATPase n=1 Tax=Alloyangia sp. H15 TaxID=3029062 RepID=A0AAU8ASJ9_9RHOB